MAIYAACVQVRIVFLPLNTGYTANEVSNFVESSGAKLLICDSSNKTALTPVAQSAGAQLETLDADGGS